jgi:hypothetical protein
MNEETSTNDLLSKTLRKLDNFLKGKQVMFTKPYKDLTDREKKTLKPRQWTDKQGNIKTFVRLQARSINDL